MAIRRKDLDTFVKRLEEWLESQPSIKKNDSHYDYTVPTIFDTNLFVKIDRDSSYCFTVFTRFEEVEKVNGKLSSRLNPYSGKYNFHLTLANPIEAADYIIQELEELTNN